MKKLLIPLFAGLLAFSFAARAELTWSTDLPSAIAKAKKENKLVLMDFTGSDWCGWCIKLKKEVFDTSAFEKYAKDNLVLVEVDFPQKKKLSADLKKANDALQSKYGASGFPTIVVLNGDGKQVWKQVGYMEGGSKAWTDKLDAAKKK